MPQKISEIELGAVVVNYMPIVRLGHFILTAGHRWVVRERYVVAALYACIYQCEPLDEEALAMDNNSLAGSGPFLWGLYGDEICPEQGYVRAGFQVDFELVLEK